MWLPAGRACLHLRLLTSIAAALTAMADCRFLALVPSRSTAAPRTRAAQRGRRAGQEPGRAAHEHGDVGAASAARRWLATDGEGRRLWDKVDTCATKPMTVEPSWPATPRGRIWLVRAISA